MKFPITLVVLFSLSLLSVSAAYAISESSDERKALSAKNIVFLGINFSGLKLLNEEGFIGQNGSSKCDALQFKYFEGWNEVFLIEKDKFNLNDLFIIDSYSLFMDPTINFNKNIIVDNCIIDDLDYRVSDIMKQQIIDQYIGLVDAEVCVLMIGESLSKKLGKGSYTIIYFDPADGKILLSNRYEENPSGYGFDNYWVNSIHNSLQSHEKYVKKMRKAYKIK